MLKFFRKHARGWFMLAVISVIIIVFVLYFGSSRGGRQANAIMVVDKKVVTDAHFRDEYEKLLDRVRYNLKENLTPELLKKLDLKAKAYNNLLNREIIMAKARDLKIQISDEELRRSIMLMPAFQTNGQFDENRYQQFLRYNRFAPADFEELQKANVLADRLESLIREGVKVSDQEARDWYVLQNQKINLDVIRITELDIRQALSPTDADLEAHLRQNSNRFRVPEQVKIKYVLFDANAASSEITEEDIQNFYASHKSHYQTKDRKILPLASVRDGILKELKKSRGRQDAYREAKKAREEIYQNDDMDAYSQKKGLKVVYTDFFPLHTPPAELASIKNVAEEILALKEKDVSRILISNNGYYLLQLLEKKPPYLPPLKDIKNEVRNHFIQMEKKRLAEKEAHALLSRLRAGENFEKTVSEKGLKIIQTGFFQPGETIPGVGQNPEIPDILVQLTPNKPYPEKPLLINDAYVILKLREAVLPDEATIQSQKEISKRMLLALKQEKTVHQWIESTKARMIKEKRLRILKKLEEL